MTTEGKAATMSKNQPVRNELTPSPSVCLSTNAENSTKRSLGPVMLRPCQGGGTPTTSGEMGRRAFAVRYPGSMYGGRILSTT